ncbi:MAG: DMT family transporter [bacterium]|nr:DMT family transporter [bacterium]
MASPPKWAAIASLLTAMVSWALAPVFIRYLSDAYDPYTQAFARYLSATIALLAVCLVWFRPQLRALFRNSWPLLGVAALNAFQQCLWTAGTYGSTATMAQLIATSNVVLVIVFSYFLFHEERRVIKSPVYLAGTLLSLAGVAAVLAKEPGSLKPVIDTSAVLLLMTSVCWAVYKVWSKHLVMGMHPLPMFAIISAYTTVFLGVISFVLGDPGSILAAGPRISLVTFVSGLLPIAAAHTAFNHAQKHLGAAFSSSCNLVVPLLTFVFGMLILGNEYLNLQQWIGASALISGVAMVTWAHQRYARLARATASGNSGGQD